MPDNPIIAITPLEANSTRRVSRPLEAVNAVIYLSSEFEHPSLSIFSQNIISLVLHGAENGNGGTVPRGYRFTKALLETEMEFLAGSFALAKL